MAEALVSRLTDDESVVYELASTGPLIHHEEEGTRERGGGDGGTLLAATDRKLVFVIDTKTGRQTADIPLADLKRIEREDSLLSTTLVLTVWGRGTFRFKPSNDEDVDDLITYATDASQTWQRVTAALQDARQHITQLRRHLEHGEMEDASSARDAAIDNVEAAADRITVGPDPTRAALVNRIKTVREELREAVMQARASRGRELLTEVETHSIREKYDEAYQTLQRARDHFETALTIAIEDGLDEAQTLQGDVADLADQEQTLLCLPLERAERTRERAQDTDKRDAAVTAWERALERYQTALWAGWGTDAEFEGETAALRMQIEWVTAIVIRERGLLATELAAEGDDARDDGDDTRALACYNGALGHLDRAVELARQHRVGDADALAARCSQLQAKRESLV